MIYIANKRRKEESIRKQYPNAIILDVTSKAGWAQRLSPFYPHGGIPIPNSDGMTGMSVEGIWQGLKVFETQGVSYSHFRNASMKGLKRTVRTLGKPFGHSYGTNSEELLDYLNARIAIYLPTYKWVLDNVPAVKDLVDRIRIKSLTTDIVFLDYNTNEDYTNLKSPLSHAALLKLYIEGRYPSPTLVQLCNKKSEDNTCKSNRINVTSGILPFFDEI